MRRSRFFLLATCLIAFGFYFVAQSSDEARLPQIPSEAVSSDTVNAAFVSIGSISPDSRIRSVLVNHHLLAPHLIASALARVATVEQVTVVVVSPDHFERGPTWATTASADWLTPFGVMSPDEQLVQRLADAGAASRPAVIAREHGITNLTAFIHAAIPNARFVPLLLKSGAPVEVVVTLVDALVDAGDKVLLVGSFDFTHDSTASQARANDAVSISVLERGDLSFASSITVDSVAGVRVLMLYAERIGTRFTLVGRSDSSEVLNQPNRTDVTSYIVGTWSP